MPTRLLGCPCKPCRPYGSTSRSMLTAAWNLGAIHFQIPINDVRNGSVHQGFGIKTVLRSHNHVRLRKPARSPSETVTDAPNSCSLMILLITIDKPLPHYHTNTILTRFHDDVTLGVEWIWLVQHRMATFLNSAPLHYGTNSCKQLVSV